MTPGQPQPQAPDLNFDFATPQIGDQVAVAMTISDSKRLLSTQVVLPWHLAKQLGQAMIMAAEKAETQLVKPQSMIASA